jgi:hypothetical protein
MLNINSAWKQSKTISYISPHFIELSTIEEIIFGLKKPVPIIVSVIPK